MSALPKNFRAILYLSLAVSIVIVASSARGQLAPEPTEDLPAPTASYLADDAVSFAIESCYPKPCFKYRKTLLSKKYYCHGPGVNSALMVEHPGDCKCVVEVPVCLPDCLEGPPVVKSRCKLGRGVVTYTWCNGFTVKVVFRKKCDIVVTYQPWFK